MANRLNMRTSPVYTKDFYDAIGAGTASSAKALLPHLQQLIQPASVIDVGCGIGHWLAAWKEAGVSNICGLDGDYIKEEQLLIPAKNFIATDLTATMPVKGKFDLVISLEVAEHLPAEKAKHFIASLCQLGDLILFSAAVPGQGGFHHFNEQYPGYWAALFREEGFLPFDCLRPVIWKNQSIDKCYRQNILFFMRKEATSNYPKITAGNQFPLDIVHPEYLDDKQAEITQLKKILKNPFRIIGYYFKALGRKLEKKEF